METINIQEYKRNKIKKDQAQKLTNLDNSINVLTDKLTKMLKEIEELKKFNAFQNVTENLKAVKGN